MVRIPIQLSPYRTGLSQEYRSHRDGAFPCQSPSSHIHFSRIQAYINLDGGGDDLLGLCRAAQYRYEVMQTLQGVRKQVTEIEEATRKLDRQDAKILRDNKEIFRDVPGKGK